MCKNERTTDRELENTVSQIENVIITGMNLGKQSVRLYLRQRKREREEKKKKREREKGGEEEKAD